MNHTNYFARFDRKDKAQEDPLTRAFLSLVRLVPAVQSMFVDAVRASQVERGADVRIPPRSQGDVSLVRTQIGDLRADAGRVVSILITNESWDGDLSVTASLRTPVYDGVIHYAGDWVLVLENKPFGGVRKSQLHPNTGGSDTLTVEPTLVVLVWKKLIRRLHTLTGVGVLDITQKQLVRDFIQYIQAEFPDLNPYPTFAACRDHHSLLRKRCEDILRELAPGRVERHKNWRSYINVSEMNAARMVALHPVEADDTWAIELSIHPGDTVTQARPFYRQVDANALLGLQGEWACRPNLHFSFIQKNLVWTHRDIPLGEYIAYWQENPRWIGQAKEKNFGTLLNEFQDSGLMTQADVEAFREHFLETNRTTANVCPGVSLRMRWSKEEAETLDETPGRFGQAISENVRQAVSTWGESNVWDEIVQK
jgi:hypothetical protein